LREADGDACEAFLASGYKPNIAQTSDNETDTIACAHTLHAPSLPNMRQTSPMVDAYLPVQGTCLVIGHRGSPSTFAENTLRSFRRAFEEGADGVEADVRVTSDGGLVVIHDSTLDRTTPLTGRVEDAATADVQAAGVPRVEELLDLVEEVGGLANLEIKTLEGNRAADLGVAVAELVTRRRLQGRVFLSSFDLEAVIAAKAAYPDIGAAWLTLPGFPAEAAAETAHANGLDGVHAGVLGMDGTAIAAAVEAAHTHSLWYMAWTVDDPATVLAVARAGADAVCTNLPEMARTVITREATSKEITTDT
jgi:glycerophosphoryl diester phosphodiesterase